MTLIKRSGKHFFPISLRSLQFVGNFFLPLQGSLSCSLVCSPAGPGERRPDCLTAILVSPQSSVAIVRCRGFPGLSHHSPPQPDLTPKLSRLQDPRATTTTKTLETFPKAQTLQDKKVCGTSCQITKTRVFLCYQKSRTTDLSIPQYKISRKYIMLRCKPVARARESGAG